MVGAFWGEIIEESSDSGPYKLVKMRADGHEFTATVVEPYGLQSSALKGGQGLIIPVNGDMGQAVVIPMPAPAKRVDGQKPGETQLKNHDTGHFIKLDADGTCRVNATKIVLEGEVHLGAEGGKLVHRKDDVDSGGDLAVGSATKVYAV